MLARTVLPFSAAACCCCRALPAFQLLPTLHLQYGPNFMTELTVQQRAKYFGLRKKGKSYAQFLEEQVAMLRRTSRISGEQMERAAQAMEAARLADADEVSAAQAQSLDGIPDW
jgi:hypothetical protein